MEEKIAFDLDGVLCDIYWNHKYLRYEWWKLKKAHENSLFYNHICFKLLNCKPKLLPTGKYILIISSRSSIFRSVTENWLKIYFNKSTRSDCSYYFLKGNERIQFKERMIKELQITKYYEDEIEIILALSALCPDTEILTPEDAIANGDAIIHPLAIKE